MGYDLHILRRNNWFEEGPNISQEDWDAYLESDKEFVGSEWHGHSDGHPVPFYFTNGSVQVKNPDEEIIQKMKRVSQNLAAKVQGDEGEVY